MGHSSVVTKGTPLGEARGYCHIYYSKYNPYPEFVLDSFTELSEVY